MTRSVEKGSPSGVVSKVFNILFNVRVLFDALMLFPGIQLKFYSIVYYSIVRPYQYVVMLT